MIDARLLFINNTDKGNKTKIRYYSLLDKERIYVWSKTKNYRTKLKS